MLFQATFVDRTFLFVLENRSRIILAAGEPERDLCSETGWGKWSDAQADCIARNVVAADGPNSTWTSETNGYQKLLRRSSLVKCFSFFATHWKRSGSQNHRRDNSVEPASIRVLTMSPYCQRSSSFIFSESDSFGEDLSILS